MALELMRIKKIGSSVPYLALTLYFPHCNVQDCEYYIPCGPIDRGISCTKWRYAMIGLGQRAELKEYPPKAVWLDLDR